VKLGHNTECFIECLLIHKPKFIDLFVNWVHFCLSFWTPALCTFNRTALGGWQSWNIAVYNTVNKLQDKVKTTTFTPNKTYTLRN